VTQKTGQLITTLAKISQPSYSPAGQNEYYSEADYWWPGDTGYIRRDGFSNPNAYHEHRTALHEMAREVPSLVLAGEFSDAADILRAWFVDPATMMAPHLLYGQAIPSHCTGRDIGIVDTLPLVEVALSAERAGIDVKDWFAQYLRWLTTHPYGVSAGSQHNNHATSYYLQVAVFAQYTEQPTLVQWCRNAFPYLLAQMAPDGSFPAEMARTRSYVYSMMQLDLMAALAQVLSTWDVTISGGRCMSRAFDYMSERIDHWHRPDVVLWDLLPVRNTCMLLGSQALKRPSLAELWGALPVPTHRELLRNFPLQHAELWLA
jgi:hypothetical protein